MQYLKYCVGIKTNFENYFVSIDVCIFVKLYFIDLQVNIWINPNPCDPQYPPTESITMTKTLNKVFM